MNASSASASSDARRTAAGDRAQHLGERVLVCGVNWIGDTVMSMPALQAYRKANPSARITLLVKPGLLPLWKLHAAPDQLLTLEGGWSGTLRTVRALRTEKFARAFVLPHSFRSALVPWLARIPLRIGMPGHWRDAMLTQVIRPRDVPGRRHQAYEYLDLMVPDAAQADLELPQIKVPEAAEAAARERLAAVPAPRVGVIPGAARGPSKQWPAEHFAELGRLLAGQRGCGLVVLGITREADLCGDIARRIGPAAVNLAGRTSLPEWIALLRACDLIVANDSGGMHLAAAVGTPVVALYGITDPAKTGPIGRICRVLQNSEVRARDISRDSPAARKSLASIHPEQVYRAALDCLEQSHRATGKQG
ncbi:MAG: lipopolysaccharide heptosyltransferase II [Verrucomicrobiota bacterium]